MNVMTKGTNCVIGMLFRVCVNNKQDQRHELCCIRLLFMVGVNECKNQKHGVVCKTIVQGLIRNQ